MNTQNDNKCNGCNECQNEASELHTCPYKEEICDDYETLCDCCKKCKTDCAENI